MANVDQFFRFAHGLDSIDRTLKLGSVHVGRYVNMVHGSGVFVPVQFDPEVQALQTEVAKKNRETSDLEQIKRLSVT